MQLGAFQQKAVLHPFPQGHDFGQLHAQAVAGQDAGDAVEQAGAVGGADVQQPALGFFIGLQAHVGGNRKAAGAARGLAAHWLGQRGGSGQRRGQTRFDQRGEGAGLHLQLRGQHLKGVECMAVRAGVDAGVQDGEVGLVKIPANAGKQILRIRRIDQHLYAFTGQRGACPHDGLWAAHVQHQLPGVPSDVGGLVAQEVAGLQRIPEQLGTFCGPAPLAQQDLGLLLACLGQGLALQGLPAEHAQGGMEQVRQQLALPGAPHLGTGAANVGHGQQVQTDQALGRLHAIGKGADDGRIIGVLLLRHGAHAQVFAHQKLDQICIGGGHLVLAGKAAHFNRPHGAVVAPPAFADVVKQGGQVQQPRLGPLAGQL